MTHIYLDVMVAGKHQATILIRSLIEPNIANSSIYLYEVTPTPQAKPRRGTIRFPPWGTTTVPPDPLPLLAAVLADYCGNPSPSPPLPPTTEDRKK